MLQSPRGSSFQRDKKMFTRPSAPLSRWSTLVIPHDGRIQSSLTSWGISCRRMAIVVRNPTCSRGEVIRKQFCSCERWHFHQHAKTPFSKLRLVTQSLELFNIRAGELTLLLMSNMSQVSRSSASEDQDRVTFYCSLCFLRIFQKTGRNSSHIWVGFVFFCMLHHTWEEAFPVQYPAGGRNLTFLLTRKLAATARPCVKLSMVLASRLRYPLICKEKEEPLIKGET